MHPLDEKCQHVTNLGVCRNHLVIITCHVKSISSFIPWGTQEASITAPRCQGWSDGKLVSFLWVWSNTEFLNGPYLAEIRFANWTWRSKMLCVKTTNLIVAHKCHDPSCTASQTVSTSLTVPAMTTRKLFGNCEQLLYFFSAKRLAWASFCRLGCIADTEVWCTIVYKSTISAWTQ